MATPVVKIGPTFPFELQKAGVLGLPFSWGSDGSINYSTAMTPSQITAVNTVYANHNATTSALLGYSDNARKLMFASGITISGILTDVSPDAVSLLHQNVTYAQGHPTATFPIIAPDFSVQTYSSSDVILLYNVVQGYVNSVYAMQAQNAAGINSGSITTEAKIDQNYATIPKTYSLHGIV